jgi:hypothetical protein
MSSHSATAPRAKRPSPNARCQASSAGSSFGGRVPCCFTNAVSLEFDLDAIVWVESVVADRSGHVFARDALVLEIFAEADGSVLASLCRWLAGSKSSYVTGVALPVDGGYLAQ